MECETDCLPDILNDRNKWHRTGVVQFSKSVASADLIVNYLEACSNVNVEKIYCHFSSHQDISAAVVLLQKPLQGSKSLTDIHGTLRPLGSPAGVYVGNLPPGVGEETLLLYFERPQTSGGAGDYVDKVELWGDRAVIYINQPSAIYSILEFKNHKVSGQTLQILPFFSSVHTMMQYWNKKSKQETKPVQAMASLHPPPPSHAFKSSPPMTLESPGQKSVFGDLKKMPGSHKPPIPPRQTSQQNPKSSQGNLIFLGDIGDGDAVADNYNAPCAARVLDQRKALFETPPFYSGQPGPKVYPHHAGGQQNQGTKFIPDETAEQETAPLPAAKKTGLKPKKNNRQNKSGPNMGQNMHTVGGHPCEQNENLSCTKTFVESPQSVKFLIMNRFGRDNNSDTVKINLQINKGKVTVTTDTKEQLMQLEIKMREILDSVVTKPIGCSPNMEEFLKQGDCQRKIEFMLREKHIKALLFISPTRVNWKGFSDSDFEKAESFLKEVITVFKVNFKPNQADLAEEAVQKTKNDSRSKFAMAFFTPNTHSIEILCLEEDEGRLLETNIRKHMHIEKDEKFQPEKEVSVGKVKLEGQKAQCFKKFCHERLTFAISTKGGQLEVEESRSREDLTLEIVVTGTNDDIELVNSNIRDIWHEHIDLKSLATDDDEHMLISSLKSREGTYFLKSCEQQFDCVLKLTDTNGFTRSVSTPQMSVEDPAIDGGSSSSSESGDEETERNEASIRNYFVKSDEDDRPSRHFSSREQRQRAWTLQGQMDPDEAYQQAIQESLMEQHRPRQPRGGYVETLATEPYFCDSSDDDINLFTDHTWAGHQILKLQKGGIANFKADVLVNVLSPKLSLRDGVITQSFLKCGGAQYQQAFDRASQQSQLSQMQISPSSWTFIKTPGYGNLQCQAVFHVTLSKTSDQNAMRSCLNEVIQRIVKECVQGGYTSLAVPPLGVGRMYSYPDRLVAQQMYDAFFDYLQPNMLNIQAATVVIYDGSTLQEFKKVSGRSSRQGFSSPFAIRPVPKRQGLAFRQASPSAPAALGSGKSFAECQPAYNNQALGGPGPQQQTFQYHSQKLRSLDEFRRQQQSLAQAPSGRPQSASRHRHKSTNVEGSPSQERPRRHKDRERRRPRQSRYAHKPPLQRMRITVYAKNKDCCSHAKRKVENKIKDDLLFEKKFDKYPKVTKEAKESIAKLVNNKNIRCIKGNNSYILRGRKEDVIGVNEEILKVFLKTRPSECQQQARKRHDRGSVDFIRETVKDGHWVPKYWKHFNPGKPLQSLFDSVKNFAGGRKYHKVELDQSDSCYKTIVHLVNKTFDHSKVGQGQDAKGLDRIKHTKLWVTKVERIENVDLYSTYCNRRAQVLTSLVRANKGCYGKVETLRGSSGAVKSEAKDRELMKDMYPEVNEVYMFHGSRIENIKTICNDGLDARLGSEDGMLGKGVYGAEMSMKADQYADDKNQRSHGELKMFLIRMLLGNCYLCSDPNPHKFKRAPCCLCKKDACQHEGEKYDSVIGDNKKLFREFVVYHPDQSYPEYLITYQRR